MIFHALDSDFVANALNLVVLTAALSVYNSCVYCNSRMLLGLAQQGHAPAALGKINKRGIPLNALGVSAIATGLCVLLNFVMPGQAFGLLMSLVVAALVINWIMICVTHLKFRHTKARQGETTRFQSFAYPISNYICLLFLVGILGIMAVTPGIQISVWMIPFWIAVIAMGYYFKQRSSAATLDAATEQA